MFCKQGAGYPTSIAQERLCNGRLLASFQKVTIRLLSNSDMVDCGWKILIHVLGNDDAEITVNVCRGSEKGRGPTWIEMHSRCVKWKERQ